MSQAQRLEVAVPTGKGVGLARTIEMQGQGVMIAANLQVDAFFNRLGREAVAQSIGRIHPQWDSFRTRTVFAHTAIGESFKGEIDLGDWGGKSVNVIPPAIHKKDRMVFAELGDGAVASIAGDGRITIRFVEGKYRIRRMPAEKCRFTIDCGMDERTGDPVAGGKGRLLVKGGGQNAGLIVRSFGGDGEKKLWIGMNSGAGNAFGLLVPAAEGMMK